MAVFHAWKLMPKGRHDLRTHARPRDLYLHDNPGSP
jgi:hypothetical protein